MASCHCDPRRGGSNLIRISEQDYCSQTAFGRKDQGMKKTTLALLCLICTQFLWAVPSNNTPPHHSSEKTLFFKDAGILYYSARTDDYTDGRFTGLSGKINVQVTDKNLIMDVLYNKKNNPRTYSLIITNISERMNQNREKVLVYKGYYAGDTTRATVIVEFGDEYASITSMYYSKLFFDYIGTSNSGMGSGFAINSNIIVTNQHVVNGNEILFAVKDEFDTNIVDLEVVYQDYDLDLAILRSTKKLTACAIDRKIYDIGEDVIAYGYPQTSRQGQSLKATKGIISSRKGLRDDVKTYQIDAAIQPGNSGGPLARGDKVIGIVVSSLRPSKNVTSQNVNYAIKSNFLGAVLDVLKIENNGKAKPKDCTYFIHSVDEKDMEEYIRQ